MTAEARLGLALGVVMGTAYGACQWWGVRHGLRPDAVAKPLAGSVVRLGALILMGLAILQLTDADRVSLAIGIMASYGAMFAMMMWRVVWKKSDKS